MWFLSHWKALVIFTAIGAALCFAVIICLRGREAEFALHAVQVACITVEKHIDEHGEWPTSWEELNSTSATQDTIYLWPRDSKEIRERVEIDFGLTLETVARQDAKEFSAIRSRVPAYKAYNNEIESLLATARRKVTEKSAHKDR